MPARSKKKKQGDVEMVDFLSEQVSGEEAIRHEQEPVGLADMPSGTGFADDAPEFRPIARDYFLTHAAPVPDAVMPEPIAEELPTHEGYRYGAEQHARMRTIVIGVAAIVAVGIGGVWLAMSATGVVRGAGPVSNGPTVSEIESQLGNRFTDFANQFGLLREQMTPPPSEPTEAEISASTAQLDALRSALGAAATATSTSTNQAPQ